MPRKYALKLTRAQALLKCERGPAGPSWTNEQIAEAYGPTDTASHTQARRREEDPVVRAGLLEGAEGSCPPRPGLPASGRAGKLAVR